MLEAKDPTVVLPAVYVDHTNPSLPALDTHLYFYLRKDGSITDPMGIGMSLDPTWEGALMDMCDAIARQRLFPPLPSTVQHDSVLIAYNVASVPVRTEAPILTGVTLPSKIASRSNPRLSHGHSMKLLSLTVPIFPAHTTPQLRPGSPKPVYPEGARRAGAEDYVVAGFVIGPDGVPVRSTIDITAAHYQEFIASVMEAIPKLPFTPATMMGCAINAYVQMPLAFNLNR